MFLSVVRSLTDYLNDDVSGSLSASLSEMTQQGLYDGSDVAPDVIETIVDQTRNPEVARGFPPLEASGKDKPSLSILIADTISFGAPGHSGGSPEVAQDERDVVVEIIIRYYLEDYARNRLTDNAQTDAYYYSRALLKSIKKFNRNKTARTRNKIVFKELLSMTFEPIIEQDEFIGLSWAYRLQYRITDQRP